MFCAYEEERRRKISIFCVLVENKIHRACSVYNTLEKNGNQLEKIQKREKRQDIPSRLAQQKISGGEKKKKRLAAPPSKAPGRGEMAKWRLQGNLLVAK